jgi:putative ABC transport system permease protein
MIRQTIILFFRTLARSRSLAAINVLGLALGFSSCILIALFLFDQLGYDSYHTNLKRIYRINTRFVSEGSVDHVAIAAAPLPYALMQNYPEVEACARLERRGAGVVVKCESHTAREDNAYSADAAVFRIFSYEFLHGDPQTALSGLNKVVLTKSHAIKYFGQTDIIGKSIVIGNEDHLVTAVIEDIPENSDLRFTMLTSIDDNSANPDWFDFSYYVFVLFKAESMDDPGFLSAFGKKLQALADEHINAPIEAENIDMSASMHIQPLQGLHFDNTLAYDTPKGNKNYVYIFASVAALILFVACINYINFSIVQSMEKSREAGVRKVVGSSFYQLVARYITQSFLIALFGAIIAIGVVYLLLPFFNGVVGRNFSMADVFRVDIVIAIGIILVVTGVLAGSYPAFYASSVNIVSALKGHVSSPGGSAIRKLSITVQFAVSLGLIIATAVIYSQMQFVRSYDLGFSQDNVLAITTPEDSAYYQSISQFRHELLAHNHLVKNVSIVGDGAMPGDPDDEQRGTLSLTNGNGETEVRMINNTYVDAEYFSVLSIQPTIGRAFEKGNVSDQQNAIIVNEALVQALGWKDPLAQTITWAEKERGVIGVVGNIHYKSLYNPVQPQIFVPHERRIVNVLVAIQPNAHDRIGEIQNLWQKYLPGEPFSFRYLDDTLLGQYQQEQTAAKISTYFSVLTIVISALGIFGLSLLSAWQRRKEIGIRKIVGASFRDIARLFFSEYLLLLAIALTFISPIVWFSMERWLSTFVDHTPLHISMFIVIGAVFAFLTLAVIVVSIRKVTTEKTTELIRTNT